MNNTTMLKLISYTP